MNLSFKFSSKLESVLLIRCQIIWDTIDKTAIGFQGVQWNPIACIF